MEDKYYEEIVRSYAISRFANLYLSNLSCMEISETPENAETHTHEDGSSHSHANEIKHIFAWNLLINRLRIADVEVSYTIRAETREGCFKKADILLSSFADYQNFAGKY